MNRRTFLWRRAAGAAAVAAGVAVVPGVLDSARVGAVNGQDGEELVVNGSFEVSAPGADMAGWSALA